MQQDGVVVVDNSSKLTVEKRVLGYDFKKSLLSEIMCSSWNVNCTMSYRKGNRVDVYLIRLQFVPFEEVLKRKDRNGTRSEQE